MDPRLPGISSVDDVLQRSLDRLAPGHAWVNRLARETSPYLLQHAHNPVNWFAWGEEAFARARAENKLVLVSIGYSTCHWCHVMEHESFEDEEIAAFINAHYIPVKVDREERPDVDGIYMSAVQMISGHGGWPMTVFALADQRPVYAGTYFPARDGDRGTRLGFLSLLREIDRRYRETPADFEKHAAAIVKQLQPAPRDKHPVPGRDAVDSLARELAARFDPAFGGFGGAPKFPRSSQLDALMRVWSRNRDPQVATMVTITLEKMAAGGMHDQVGGGFHRYSVDAFWLVPHFEKMLYDNAQLAVAYLEAGIAFERDDFLAVTRRTLDYMLREMRDPAGGFYSATDADSRTPSGHMEEGWFFTWTPEELVEVLGETMGRRVAAVYEVSDGGNFEGRSVLHRPRTLADIAVELETTEAKLADELDAANMKLYAARALRPAPLRDDKVIAAWNGLTISALAVAGFALDAPAYLDAARAAARFVRDSMMAEGRLLRTWRGGEVRHAAVLDDYAFMTAGLLDLFEATGEGEWLVLARVLQAQLDARFWDAAGGGYFLTATDAETLIARDKPDYDGAEPAGNSVAFLNLLRLEQLTDEVGYRLLAEQGLSAFAFNLTRGAITLPKMICALDWFVREPLQLVVVGGGAMVDALRRQFLPVAVRVLASDATGDLPLLEGRIPGVRPAAYVCQGGVCDVPAHSPEELRLRVAERDS